MVLVLLNNQIIFFVAGDEDFFVYDLIEAAKDIIWDKDEDPLLSLTPVVYTTKLDEMNTVKEDLTNLNANEILNKLHSESKPMMTEVKKRSSDLENMNSFFKLAEVVSDINFKAKPRLPQNEILPKKESSQESENEGISLNNAEATRSPNASILLNSSLSLEINKLERTLSSQSVESVIKIENDASELNPKISTYTAIAPNSYTTSDNNTGDYFDDNKEYRPCYVVLQDIKYLMLPNQVTFKLPLKSKMSKTNEVDPHNLIEADVKIKQEETQTGVVEDDVEMADSSEIQTSEVQNIHKIEISVLESITPVPTNETYSFLEESHKRISQTEKIPAENLETKTTYSGRPKRKRKQRIRYDSDLDEDYVPDEDFVPDEDDLPDKDYVPNDDLPINNTKKKIKKNFSETELNVSKTEQNVTKTSQNVSKIEQSVTKTDQKCSKTSQDVSKLGQNVTKAGQDISKAKQNVSSSNISNTASAPIMSNEFLASFQEKYSLVVLIHTNKKAYLYRVNCTKLVTDYYVIEDCDEYKIALMYPKEEKIIEDYCCWYKREEVIARICARKNYSFTIQKFLKQPHTCYDECHCCCLIMNNDSSQSKQKRRLDVINRSRTAADSWIRELLNKTNSTTPGLVNKALNYIPTPTKEKPVEKQSDKYLDYYLLCLKNCKPKLEYELYEIGENGAVLRSLLLDNEEQVERIRKTYQLKLMPINDAELCCWFKREKLMHELKMLKTSPATLKLISKAHSCNYKQCLCCCKPPLVTLLAREILPSTFKQTTAYEQGTCSLTISCKTNSKKATTKSKEDLNKSKRNTRSSTTSTAAVALSERASKDDNPGTTISIMDKIKNLKLGISSSGELEAVLQAPAKNLSMPALKILSDILAISAEQMVELNLSAEEFCNKINSKSGDSGVIRETAPEASLVTTDELEPPAAQDYYDDNGMMDVEDEDDKPITSLLNKTVTTGGTDLIKRKSQPNEPPKQIISRLVPSTAKSISSTFSMISNLMEKKNENYVDSFKSFFNKSEPSKFILPNIDVLKDSSIKEVPLMPIIQETFTLAKSPTKEFNIAIPGPSGVTQQRRGNISTITQNSRMEIHSSHQTPLQTKRPIKTYKRKVNNVTNAQSEKKIRVKNASELNATILEEPPDQTSDNSRIISAWPAPIVLKREPDSNIQQIVRSGQSAIAISPNQTYIIGNNVMSSNFKIVSPTPTAVNKIFRINGNPIQVGATPATNANTVRYVTIAPIQRQNFDPSKKSILTKILKAPQTPPVASNNRNEPPPLVRFRPTLVSASDKKETSDQT